MRVCSSVCTCMCSVCPTARKEGRRKSERDEANCLAVVYIHSRLIDALSHTHTHTHTHTDAGGPLIADSLAAFGARARGIGSDGETKHAIKTLITLK